MIDRNVIKWQPFNAVAAGSYMVDEVLKEKNKIKMPELSDEQINELENYIKESYFNEEEITITYFKNGRLYRRNGFIKEINSHIGKITLNDNFNIFFKQILNIKKF